MEVGSVKSLNLPAQQQQIRSQSVEQMERQRQDSGFSLTESGKDEEKVNPEEILDKIKKITQDGEYSVRFEKADEVDEIVVKVVDNQTEEIIRQIPPEEILGIRASLKEYSGNIVDERS